MNVKKVTFIVVAAVLLLVLGCSTKARQEVPQPRILWIETTITCGQCNNVIDRPEMAREFAAISLAPGISEEERELLRREFMYNNRNMCPCHDEDKYD